MSEMYGPTMDHYPPDDARALSEAFAVDASTVLATLLALDGEIAVGQAGLRPHGEDAGLVGVLEVKKVFVLESYRGRGISRRIMLELEVVARALGSSRLVLQTGTLQHAAIGLHESLGYAATAPYPPFEVMTNALCYEKILSPI